MSPSHLSYSLRSLYSSSFIRRADAVTSVHDSWPLNGSKLSLLCEIVLSPLAPAYHSDPPLYQEWFLLSLDQLLHTLILGSKLYVSILHITCTEHVLRTMVAVVTLTGWVLPLPTTICYDDNTQDDESYTDKYTYHCSCNSPCITTSTRGTCWCCWSWSCCLRWWLSWWLRWLRGWCWRWCSCREWHTAWTQHSC